MKSNKTPNTEWFLMTTDLLNHQRVTRRMVMAILDARGVSRWDRKQALAEALTGSQATPCDGVTFRACC
jgi:hypothetical protein